MTRFDLKAIAIAMLLSLALDVMGSIFLVSLFGPELSPGMSREETTAAIEAITRTRGFMLASLVYGTATTVFGGHVVARLARSHPYFNALAIGMLGLALSLLPSGDVPAWFTFAAVVVSVPAALLGAHLALRRG